MRQQDDKRSRVDPKIYDSHTIRNFFPRVRLEEGSMGCGIILVTESNGVCGVPIASINIPFTNQETNVAVAEFFAKAWNDGKA